ncbi:ubiquitin carboxyl-terminal hydrolase puf isoform X4 [Thrips palmi]|uniref:ubiquitinyl hydrolase 1 n=1 Tax=Thrips palmi TaxID=161013 RepID=A0A6P8ZLN6_THRPL|nr:ubiquitin carboxyl-terminal hydrolase puf isoform X4 [Thrips palmi]
MKMCDICADFLELLQTYEEKIANENEERPFLQKSELEVVLQYVQSWTQRQCMCCFREAKNYERFGAITQSIVLMAIKQLRDLKDDLSLKLKADKSSETPEKKQDVSDAAEKSEDKKVEDNSLLTSERSIPVVNGEKSAEGTTDVKKDQVDQNYSGSDKIPSSCNPQSNPQEKTDTSSKTDNLKPVVNEDQNKLNVQEKWSFEEIEKLLNFVSKVFLLNFPLYVVYKHSLQAKLEEVSTQEMNSITVFCDLHDTEIPLHLFRNVCVFCRAGGMLAMTQLFEQVEGMQLLPVSISHALIAIVCNLKLWLNFRSVVQLFVPLRAKVMRYMCSLSDKELRLPSIRTMADFMWSAVKDPMDSPVTFDVDGLNLAFKYFTSPTLTMRLSGIAQINSHITLFNEVCNNENIIEIENVGQKLSEWLIENQIIAHIFGPNLHVEVIKQSHMILTFLAMECRITNEHIDIIWQAAQLKHCSRQVHDLLPPLIKHLEVGPVLHLYSLLCRLEPKEHSEQSLYLASALIKFIWSSSTGTNPLHGTSHVGHLHGHNHGHVHGLLSTDGVVGSAAGLLGLGGLTDLSKVPMPGLDCRVVSSPFSSCDNSASMEPSNSDDDQGESSAQSDGHKSQSETSDGPSPCKQPRKHRKHVRHRHSTGNGEDSSDDSLKIEDLDEDEEEEEEEEDEDHSTAVVSPKAMSHAPKPVDLSEKTKLIGKNDLEGKELRAEISDRTSAKMDKDPEESTLTNKLNRVGKCSDNDMDADVEDEVVPGTTHGTNKRKRIVYPGRKRPRKAISGKTRNVEKMKSDKGMEVMMCYEDELDEEDDEETGTDADDDCSNMSTSMRESPAEATTPEKSAKALDLIRQHMGHDHHPDASLTQGAVMTELASLVEGSQYTSPHEIHECRPFIKSFPQRLDMMDDLLSEPEGSYSSRMSTKSEKNLADFEGEESNCDEELAQLAARAHQLSQMGMQCFNQHSPKLCNRLGIREGARDQRLRSQFDMECVCKPGSTLLWDLLQDDKIGQLGEGLAIEAEKALSNLLCFNTERLIRMKFIEGCLQNIANNWSVVVSLRMLPKLLTSFQHVRNMDTHQVAMWAEQEHSMMEHFFANLEHYTNQCNKEGLSESLYSHQVQIQVRLQFLTSLFSPHGSPMAFRLTVNQLDVLWKCLATDEHCSDELFAWLLRQSKSKDLHALSTESLKHLYLHKLPSLPPDTISMTALSLYQQLCNMARVAAQHFDSEPIGMEYLWKIALRANNTDVSMAAIQYLNCYYMGRQLEQECEFVSQCMAHLVAATADLATAEEASLLCIQRALLLLKTHLETFRKRYAYHLRRWALEGRGVGSHVQLLSGERGCQTIKVVIQPAGVAEKVTLELLSSDYIADLRAEVAKWWESVQPSPALGTLLSEGPLRMITQGQELITDFDEKTLQEMGFKDMQMVFISMGASRPQKKRDSIDSPSVLPPPPRECLPTLLLLQPQYFEHLFTLMQTLSSMKTSDKGGKQIPHTKAQVLSRRVWDILTLLPTSPTLMRGFESLGELVDDGKNGESGERPSLETLLDPSSPQKLMYSLYIVESLSRSSGSISSAKNNVKLSEGENEAPTCVNGKGSSSRSWSQVYVKHGGLRHLFDIFMSGVLQRSGGDGSEWQQDCLACLLKLLCHLGMAHPEENERERSFESQSDSKETVRGTKKQRRMRKSSAEKLVVPKLNDTMLQMMKVDVVMPQLTTILHEASLPRDPNHYKTGFWGRAQVVHYAMALLVSWVHSEDGARQALFQQPYFASWLQRLVLEDPEPAVRREVCTALYRLCLGSPGSHSSSSSAPTISAPMLAQLLQFLPIAECMRPPRMENHPEDGKEPYGPACRDYFWLMCRLVDSLPEEFVRESIDDPNNCIFGIDGLARQLVLAVLRRDFLETRHNTIEDDGLVGLLNLATVTFKHRPPLASSKEGQEFLSEVFEFLFALPNPKKRHFPKCKSQTSRSAAYDLLVELVRGSPENYHILHEKLLEQHKPGPHSPYPWDYWPHEDGRSDCGYVGLTNLGATCYMASCMQHLYMMPQARTSILEALPTNSKHEQTLRELQRMFAYLLESERKAYNPRSFCKVYTMDHQPLNTGEQKDMAEFFIDLVSKLEEMTPELKKLVKSLFGGVISNNVVSLDCDHVSRTVEEFYTVRCQVADMRNLYESLDEVTVKDTLEGDNMYTCSQCGKKVRAEKRACFKKLPHIMCFNTMRYTFNMVTMLKEKVNTHFSFPMRLDMSGYVEQKLMPHRYQEEKKKAKQQKMEQALGDGQQAENCDQTNKAENCDSENEEFRERYDYDLIGVTVHTGTADGGHYYSFIRDRTTPNKDKWFFFNDAEVKPFDPNQLASECFGGEMTSKTYDSVTDKFMDFSFEKTNSAYMLFYERCSLPEAERRFSKESDVDAPETSSQANQSPPPASNSCDAMASFELNKELEDWIWQDNMHFLRDKNIFEHNYFNFMWQICGYIPQTLISLQSDITEMAAQLSTTFFLETFIHAKEKPTMVQWVELLTKQFNASQAACEWFLEHVAHNDWWPVQILIKCPNQMVRQMFQRLSIHVISQLRSSHAPLYLKMDSDDDGSEEMDPDKIGYLSCVTKFIRMLLSLMEHGAKTHLKHLTEYFALFLEFSKMGEEECQFLISVHAISTMVNFYLGQKSHEYVEVVSEEEDDEDVTPLPTDKYKPASLEKMITLVATLVEKSRGLDRNLQLSTLDFNAFAGGKGFPFLYQQIKDCINLQQTRNLIHSLCRWNERLAQHIVGMIFQAIMKHSEICQPFFKILTLLVETNGTPTGLPCFSQLVLARIWDVAEYCPQATLEWLSAQVPRNKLVHNWVLQGLDTWVEHFLIGHNNQRVRSAAAYLLASLVPNQTFRQGFRTARPMPSQYKEILNSPEALSVLHKVLGVLFRLLKPARHYADCQTHGTNKLTAYFTLFSYCCVSNDEKLMLQPYFMDLWNLFHPKLSEPAVPIHHNKQALLLFWHHVSEGCPKNVESILNNASILKNIAFNYILADHEDQEVVLFNRTMLPAYYGLLKLCCLQSRSFTRQLAAHQNVNWALKNITPHPTQYTLAVEELFKLMELFVMKHSDSTEQDIHEINTFRKHTIQLYLQILDGRSMWATLIQAYKILVENDEDRLTILHHNNGLQMFFEAFHTLHVMYHEATACHVSGDLLELMTALLELLKCLQLSRDQRGGQEMEPPNPVQLILGCKEWMDVLRKLATLLNSYNSDEMRKLSLDLLAQMAILIPNEVTQVVGPLLLHCHSAVQENHNPVPMGPFFPRSGGKQATLVMKASSRPVRPMVQMSVPHNQLEPARGVDPVYDQALEDYFGPYHNFLDTLCRIAIATGYMTDQLVVLSAMVGFEAVPLHFTRFPKLWLDIFHSQHIDRKYIVKLVNSNYFVDYVEAVLLDERSSLNIPVIYNFLSTYFPKVCKQVLTDQTLRVLQSIPGQLSELVGNMDVISDAARLNGDLRALLLVQRAVPPQPNASTSQAVPLSTTLSLLLKKILTARSNHLSDDNRPSDPPPKRRKISSGEEPSAKLEGSQNDVGAESAPDKELTTSCQNDCSSNSDKESTEPVDKGKAVSGDKQIAGTTAKDSDGLSGPASNAEENGGSGGTLAKESVTPSDKANAGATDKENAGAGPSEKEKENENAARGASPVAGATASSPVGPSAGSTSGSSVGLTTGCNVATNVSSCGPSCNAGNGPNGSCSGPNSGPVGGPCNGLEGLKDKSPLFWLDQLEKTVRDILDMLEVKS